MSATSYEMSPGTILRSCRSLKRELVRAQEEIKRIQSVPLVIGQFMEAIDQKYIQRRTLTNLLAEILQYWHRAILYWLQLRCSNSVDP